MIQVCFSSDDKYSLYLAVAIASILKNAKKTDELSFYILDGGISSANKGKIKSLKKIKNFDIAFINVNDSLFKRFPIGDNYISIQTYYRYIIPQLLPDIDKILYLDCDVIVKDSLSELYNQDISDYWIAGVEDLGYFVDRKRLKRETESFYINAGIILLNVKKWREDNITEKLFNFTRENAAMLEHKDQDVINMVLNSKSKPLDYRWNVQDSYHRSYEMANHPNKQLFIAARNNPGIIHYTSANKPWANLMIPMAKEYYKYLFYSGIDNITSIMSLLKIYIFHFYRNEKNSLYAKIFGRIKLKIWPLI